MSTGIAYKTSGDNTDKLKSFVPGRRFNIAFLKATRIICQKYEAQTLADYQPKFDAWQPGQEQPEGLRTAQIMLMRIEEFKHNLKDKEFVQSLTNDFVCLMEHNFLNKRKIEQSFHYLMEDVISGETPYASMYANRNKL